jgi:hypothetical protein
LLAERELERDWRKTSGSGTFVDHTDTGSTVDRATFPAHEFFIESPKGVEYRWNYAPDWFADLAEERAYPTVQQMLRARKALKGVDPIDKKFCGKF